MKLNKAPASQPLNIPQPTAPLPCCLGLSSCYHFDIIPILFWMLCCVQFLLSDQELEISDRKYFFFLSLSEINVSHGNKELRF